MKSFDIAMEANEIIVHCSAILFDLDGVLIDSTPAVARVWRRWAIEHGFDPEEVIAHAHGRPSLTTVREYLPNADHAAENRKVERAEIRRPGRSRTPAGHSSCCPAFLGSAGRWPVMSCTRRLAEVRIRAAGLPMPASLVASTDIVHGKPHPEPYLKGASVLGFPAAECIVVEDAPAGIRAGKASGSRVIAFKTTSAAEALRVAGADWILNDCSDIHLIDSWVSSGQSGLVVFLTDPTL